jgi:hypothetical protein
MVVAALIPQADAVQPRGGNVMPKTFALVELLGLNRVFSTWWFAALSALFFVSLLLSTFDQFRASRARMFRPPRAGGDGGVPCALSRERVERVLAGAGYRRLAGAPGTARYVKYWPGYWAGTLLHCGLLCTILFSAVYAMTEYRVAVRTVQDEAITLADGAIAVRKGLFSSSAAQMPNQFVLRELEPRFYPTGSLQSLASTIMVSDKSGAVKNVRVAISDKASWGGVRIYQKSEFGTAFLLRLQPREGGEAVEIPLWMPMPGLADKPAYLHEPLKFGRYSLKAKYFARRDRAGLLPLDPRLVLRLMDGDSLVAETELEKGSVTRFGPYLAGYRDCRLWSDIMLEGSLGVSGIFIGFFLVLAGGGLAYFVVPREVIVYDTQEAGCRLAWRRGRFAGLDDEILRVLEV